jgi:ATP-binding protein involved in chromosome partitioning
VAGFHILILGSKGGVGKSTVAAALAIAFCGEGMSAGVLDADLHCPATPRLLGVEGKAAAAEGSLILPVESPCGARVISIGFFLPVLGSVVWDYPKRIAAVRQFVGDVKWRRPDVLIADCPTGFGDEAIELASLLRPQSGAVLVTTADSAALEGAVRALSFCIRLGIPVLGIAVNDGACVSEPDEPGIAAFCAKYGATVSARFPKLRSHQDGLLDAMREHGSFREAAGRLAATITGGSAAQ